MRGDEHIPSEGAAILVCNHVSFIDPVLLMAASPRPIRFIMDHEIFSAAGARHVLPPRQGDPDRAAEGRPGRSTSRRSRARRQVLDDGDLLCIFPEGAITRDGALAEFKGGVMRLLQSNPVPVVPLALQNLWGSFFSRAGGRAMSRPFRRGVFNRVDLVAGEPMPPSAVTPAALRERVGPRCSRRLQRRSGRRASAAGACGRSARGYTGAVVKPGSACGAAWPSRSYSEITCAPNSSSVAPISRLSRTTIAVVSEP